MSLWKANQLFLLESLVCFTLCVGDYGTSDLIVFCSNFSSLGPVKFCIGLESYSNTEHSKDPQLHL